MICELPKDWFFHEFGPLMLTYRDVRLQVQYSEVLPDEVDTKTLITRNVRLQSPLVSAAMRTVTGRRMAIALAKRGGIGILPRSLSIEEQARKVARVKHHLHAFIVDPICIYVDQTVGEVLAFLNEKELDFRTLPVLASRDNRIFVGMMTATDFDACFFKPDCLVGEAMTRLQDIYGIDSSILQSSREDQLRMVMQRMCETKKRVIPVIEDGGLRGMFLRRDVERMISGSATAYALDRHDRLLVGGAIGTGDDAKERACELARKQVDLLVIDTAHAHTKRVGDMLLWCKQEFPMIDVLVGNICTGEAALWLADRGADGVKVGIGPGSICTTRTASGVGRPQVSAIAEVEYALRTAGRTIPVCADGGIEEPGDVAIAIAAGASTVMMGSRFAGCDETPGQVIIHGGARKKMYVGEGARSSFLISDAASDRYGHTGKTIAEGVESLVPCKGPVDQIIDELTGGLRLGMGYSGAPDVEAMRRKALFDRITPHGYAEGMSHGVEVVQTQL